MLTSICSELSEASVSCGTLVSCISEILGSAPQLLLTRNVCVSRVTHTYPVLGTELRALRVLDEHYTELQPVVVDLLAETVSYFSGERSQCLTKFLSESESAAKSSKSVSARLHGKRRAHMIY